jgi:hypothetical protein
LIRGKAKKCGKKNNEKGKFFHGIFFQSKGIRNSKSNVMPKKEAVPFGTASFSIKPMLD